MRIPAPLLLALAAGVSFLSSALGTKFVRSRAASWNLLDTPNARSSHLRPTPRGGGLGLLFGLGAGIVALALSGSEVSTSVWGLLLASLPVAVVGLWDDRKGLSPAVRLLTQLSAAAAFVWFHGGLDRLALPSPFDRPVDRIVGNVIAVLWMMMVTNFFNFMDGIDGLASGQCLASALGVVLAGWAGGATALAVVLAAASAGFLLHNWAPARVFLGDVGSGTLGFLLAGLPLLAPPERRPQALLATAIGLTLFLLDPLVTLGRRARRHARLTEAHREHFYQRLLVPGAGHGLLAGWLIGAAVGLSLFGAWTYSHPDLVWPAIAVAVLFFVVEVAATAGRKILRYSAIFAIDVLLVICSLYLAFFVRFEGNIPAEYLRKFEHGLLLLVPLRLTFNLMFGLHRWSFRMSGFHEAVRLVLAVLSGSACFAAFFYFFQLVGLPRSVIFLEFFFTSTGFAVFRFSPRLAAGWYIDQRRARRYRTAATIIVGAGSAGDLLLRDLMRSDEHGYHVVGFVDDDRRKIGTLLGGKPVLGEIDRLPEFVEEHEVTQVLIAIPRLPSERIQTILRLCSSLKIQFKIIPVSFAYLHDRITASMLHDLSPEDLLPRDERVFDPDEIRRLVTAKRILVTGAAGSIGGEIARQVSRWNPEDLLLVDINENDLYLLYRELLDRYANLNVHAEVADIRDAGRLARLARAYRPQYVFHAAAHKHVPLMEDAPEEAVKNNVIGTLHMARVAAEAGAERFVLISTDKAVRPSSVMGATKRVAELIVRELARGSATRFTAIRFGNVLGSAGSVVPLFKQQIARGGPVTVTHPECRRYFMTTSEAVGLVILAGLGDYGDLCVLDMGEQIRILDLANHMITMAGLVPGADVRIEFIGLRPGEKMSEELLTEEEEKTQVVRDRVFGVQSPPPPRDLWGKVAHLRRTAEAGERSELFEALRDLVPTFTGEGVPAAHPDLRIAP